MKKIIVSEKTKVILYLLIWINILYAYYVLLFLGSANTDSDEIAMLMAFGLFVLQVVRSFFRALFLEN